MTRRRGRPSSGAIVETETSRGTSYAARFTDQHGQRRFITLGSSADGWTRQAAERELADIMGSVRRGEWQAPRRAMESAASIPTFHEFASEWFAARVVEGGRRGSGLTEAGKADLQWQLSVHLLPWFARRRLDEIDARAVDEFRRAKVREGLSPTSVNKFLRVLAAILQQAVDYGHLIKMPPIKRLPARTPPRTFIDTAEGILAVLDAAGELDREATRSAPYRRPLLAVLCLAGLRIEEALSLRWDNVRVAASIIRVRGTKTDAGSRIVRVMPLLHDELISWAANRANAHSDALVFGTATGGKMNASNVRNRILMPAVERANARLEDPLPRLTPHSLRRTFASLLVASGSDPSYVMEQLGHTDAAFTLSVYSRAMRSDPGDRERLKALVEATLPDPVYTPTGSAP